MTSWRSLLFLPILLLESGCSDTQLNPIKDPPPDGTPEIEVSPESVNFGIVPNGDSVSQVLTLSSVGEVSLNVTAMQVNDGRWAFTLLEPVVGTFEPGTSADITVIYNSQGTTAEGSLEILSNDPSNPNFSVPLLAQEEEIVDTGDTGEVPPPLSQPIAVCSADPAEVLAIHESADWVGNSSYDPDGGSIVDYSWTLYSSPAGATAMMPGGTANRRGFIPDVAGEYIGELVVTDSDGLVSEPCYATLNATAGDGLWVEMFWMNSGDDMDLHLVNGGGSLATDSDCYYANCTWGGLDWGTRGVADDNPILDLDDIPGTGPENINITSPSRGTYTVYVHDYPGSSYIGRNDVTVNVYFATRLVWTDTRNINSEGCYEPFVEVTAPGGAVTSLSGGCR